MACSPCLVTSSAIDSEALSFRLSTILLSEVQNTPGESNGKDEEASGAIVPVEQITGLFLAIPAGTTIHQSLTAFNKGISIIL